MILDRSAAILELLGGFWFKIDLFLDLNYILTTPMAHDWYYPFFWLTILLPYAYMAFQSITSEKPSKKAKLDLKW